MEDQGPITKEKVDSYKIFSNMGLYAEGVLGIVFSIIGFIILNLFGWMIPFINDDFFKVLPWINLSLFIVGVSSIVLLFTKSRAVKIINKITNSIFSIIVILQFIIVYPFDNVGDANVLYENGDKLLKFLIIVVIIGAVSDIFKTLKKMYEINLREEKS